MLNQGWLSVAAAALLGFFSGLGIGGGSLLILWLTLVLRFPISESRQINLMFFLPCALIACVFRWKQGSLPLKKLIPAILTGCVTAFAASLISGVIDVNILRNLFGILLIITGIREILYKPKAGH